MTTLTIHDSIRHKVHKNTMKTLFVFLSNSWCATRN